MQLELSVTFPGAVEPILLTVDFDTLTFTAPEIVRLAQLCPTSELARIVDGEWSEQAAEAIIKVIVEREAKGGRFSDVELDWGELDGYMGDPDGELESTIPMGPV